MTRPADESGAPAPRPTPAPAPPASAPLPAGARELRPTPQAVFDPAELAIVLSHYDLGVIESVRPFRGGSRASPKLIIKSEKGAFWLKRRATGRDDPLRVEFAHQIQMHLHECGFPVPRIVMTVRHRASMITLDRRIYELYDFAKGEFYDASAGATADAGRTLAQLHRVLASVDRQRGVYSPSYHRITGLHEALRSLPRRLKRPDLDSVVEQLSALSTRAADAVDAQGIATWPFQLIHGDWHPGNLLFRDGKVTAVFDFDTVRLQPRVIDFANGLLQFSMTRGGTDPESWPDEPDITRFRAFFEGYDQTRDVTISEAEIKVVPWLMAEALVVEAVGPIAATGKFGVLDGPATLRMVARKARWLTSSVGRLIEVMS